MQKTHKAVTIRDEDGFVTFAVVCGRKEKCNERGSSVGKEVATSFNWSEVTCSMCNKKEHKNGY